MPILAETNLTMRDRDSWFARFEAVGKTAHDLAVAESDEVFTVAKLQGGYTRYFLTTWRGLNPGLGATLSAGFVPAELSAAYGGRVNVGWGVFLTLRPAAMTMHAGHDAGERPIIRSMVLRVRCSIELLDTFPYRNI